MLRGRSARMYPARHVASTGEGSIFGWTCQSLGLPLHLGLNTMERRRLLTIPST